MIRKSTLFEINNYRFPIIPETKFFQEDKGHAIKECEKAENKRRPAVQGESSTLGLC